MTIDTNSGHVSLYGDIKVFGACHVIITVYYYFELSQLCKKHIASYISS